MKISVFDKKNPERLLGTIAVHDGTSLMGVIYKMAVRQALPQSYGKFSWEQELRSDGRTVEFYIDVKQTHKSRQIDPSVREITTFERKVFLTTETLETLMKLEQFTVSGETAEQKSFREHIGGRTNKPMSSFY